MIPQDIQAALRGEPVVPADPRAFVDLALDEGLAPLVLQRAAVSGIPADGDTRLRASLRLELGLATVREIELRRVLDGLAAAGADVLVIKGAHVAHAFYEHPALRPRQDADVLVRPDHRDAALAALAALGYQRRPAITGEAVQGQTVFDRPDTPAAVLDVHWRLSSPILAADLFDFDRLWTDAQPLPALGAQARVPHVFDAIAIAAVHQFAHHATEPHVLWLYDLHVMLRTLDRSQAERFVEQARARGMSAICAAAIGAAEAAFPTAAGSCVLAMSPPSAAEPSAALLTARTPAAQMRMDVRALPGWRARLAYVGGHLFPPADYMRTTYAANSTAPLAWLYLRRIVAGARRVWSFRRPGL